VEDRDPARSRDGDEVIDDEHGTVWIAPRRGDARPRNCIARHLVGDDFARESIQVMSETVREDATPTREHELSRSAWNALLAGAGDSPRTAPPTLIGASAADESTLPSSAAATASIATALRAAGALLAARNGTHPELSLPRAHVLMEVTSERHFSVDGHNAAMLFAPLSRYWRAGDGWIRTHGNFPWHRDALLTALACADDPPALESAIAERSAYDIETKVMAAGGVAAAVRTLDEWRAHPQGRAVADEPLISHHWLPRGAARRRSACDLPARGVRVLDLTRVIAGPVCTRYLAALGADVLRIDPPQHRDDIARGAAADTLLGKRSAFVDLATTSGRATLHDLLGSADVVVFGYRTGALDRFGLHANELAVRYPGLVIVTLNAWGHHGPWADRRGFDSVVQAPTGIGMLESCDGETPGALPFQLLDHGTGYLAAAAALDGLRRQAAEGGTHLRRLSLARTANWLTSAVSTTTRATPALAVDPSPWLQQLDLRGHTTSFVSPPGMIDGVPLQWSGSGCYGSDDASWRS
jgi:crotonobetainyl-CoA:carnitine CoA-transferase CaiB-like acyl-CoA transferase